MHAGEWHTHVRRNQYFTKKPPHPGYGGYYTEIHPGMARALIAAMSNIVTPLLVQHDIEALGFLLDADTQRAEQCHQFQQPPGNHGSVYRHHHDTEQLHAELLQHAVAFQRETIDRKSVVEGKQVVADSGR